MKKIKWATHKNLFSQIASSSCLLAVSAGVVFGVSAGTFKVQYLNLNDPAARLQAVLQHNYFSQNIKSQWNMFQQGKEGDDNYIKGVDQPATQKVDDNWWGKVHPGTTPLYKPYNNIDPENMQLTDDKGVEIPSGTEISESAMKERAKYSALVIDGSTHTALDRSFNQGLYNGLANFNTNIQHTVFDDSEAQIFKPSQDSTQEFVNIYRAVSAKTRVLSLAGFNHVTPLNALGKRNADGIYEFTDKNIANAGMMLMDGDIANNQNVASVLFRSDQPAFLSALATCMYFYNNLDLYHANYRDISVAAYGGTAIPTVIIYMGGFQRGIEFFNRFVLKDKIIDHDARAYIMQVGTPKSDYFEKKLLPASKYKAEVEELKELPAESKGKKEFLQKMEALFDKLYDEYSIKMIKLGDFGTHFSGSFAAGDAIGISKQYLNRGASAIIAVAGPQSLDTAQEIMNQNSNCIVIGVDSAMETSDYQKPFKNPNFKDKTVAASGDGTISAQASNIIKFSAVKDMTNVSDKMLRLAANGKHWDVNSTSPWMSASLIPDWTSDEEIPFEKQYYKIHNNGDGTFDVQGFAISTSMPTQKHVMNIPVHWTDPTDPDKKVLKLNAIWGFDLGDASQVEAMRNVDTFKISGELADDEDPIVFGTIYEDEVTHEKKLIHGFNYDTWDASKGEKPGIKYVDLTDIPCAKFRPVNVSARVFYRMSDTKGGTIKCKAYQNGIVKFYKNDTNGAKENAWGQLFNDVEETGSGNSPLIWAKIEPDPYSSICSFGFKTCGNIENGLISISWDGWPLLLEALKHCDFFYDEGEEMSFEKVWIGMANGYATEYESVLDKDFYKFLTTTTDINQYSTFDTNSVLKKNYAHVMTILGRILNKCSVEFPADMTILFDKNDKPYLPTGATYLTILDWLKFNMYFTM